MDVLRQLMARATHQPPRVAPVMRKNGLQESVGDEKTGCIRLESGQLEGALLPDSSEWLISAVCLSRGGAAPRS